MQVVIIFKRNTLLLEKLINNFLKVNSKLNKMHNICCFARVKISKFMMVCLVGNKHFNEIYLI